jgi:hypothetical protein
LYRKHASKSFALVDASHRSCQKTKEMKILFTGFSQGDLHRYRRTVVRLGGSVVMELPFEEDNRLAASIRVVIPSKQNGLLQHQAQKRTLNYFNAILAGAWILSPEWITASNAQDRWLPESDFQIVGDIACIGGPQHGREHGSRLFSGLRMHFPGNGEEQKLSRRGRSCVGLDEKSLPRLIDLTKLALRGGAEVLSAMTDLTPSASTPSHLSTEERAMISRLSKGRSDRAWWQYPIEIFLGEGTAEWKSGNGSCAWLRCSHTWMFDCISRGELLDPTTTLSVEEKRLSNDATFKKAPRMWNGQVALEVE